MRVHLNQWAPQGKLIVGFFRDPKPDPAFPDREPSMSCDWNKYSTPEETRGRDKKAPTEYGVIQLIVENVRKVPLQRVEHTPIHPTNQAHSDIFGRKKDEKIRLKLWSAASWVPGFGPS